MAITLGFNPDGNPVGDQDARPWAREIARTNRILSWDFPFTEGENAILPHYRFDLLFEQRRLERDGAPYSGGICYTMTPRLNQLSLFEAARSFQAPDADHRIVAREFFAEVFGPEGEPLAADIPLFERVPDRGHVAKIEIDRDTCHRRMKALVKRLRFLRGRLSPALPLFPSAESYRRELLFFTRLFAGLTGPSPDCDALRRAYWQRVYRIHELLPRHIDPRPAAATDNLANSFRRGGQPSRTTLRLAAES